MDKDEKYDSFNISTGLWDEDVDSAILKRFRKDYELYEAEREIVTRLLQQMLNNEEVE
tara:strand:+ start:1408 stop:1581 length:174 start_codon:yes stop_codon:yes gene_type:complete